MSNPVDAQRTFALVGTGGCGKTSLAEMLLFTTGAISRMGAIEEGTTSLDYEPEEVRRRGSIQPAVATWTWNKNRHFLLDIPGDGNFTGDMEYLLKGVDSALFVLDAVDGVRPLTKKLWSAVREEKLPALFVINKLDRDRADFSMAFDSLSSLGVKPVALHYPLREGEAFTGYVDVLTGKAWKFGPDGAATPVALFDPVVVAGSTVRHASLHNADEIARLDVRVGDTVIIYKAGDIIPQVKAVLTTLREPDAQPFDYEQALKAQYPDLEFERPAGEVVYRVKGENSELMLKRSLEYFASKAALDIEGLGARNVSALVDAGLLKGIADVYRLRAEQIAQLERFGVVSAQNLVAAIEASKHAPLHKFITALGIRHVGGQTAVLLADHFQSLERLAAATKEELQTIPDIGEIVAESILAWFGSEDNMELLAELRELGVAPVYVDTSALPLAGQSYIISGTIAGFGREEAEERLRARGATITKSVTKATTALIVGEKPGKSKLDKAQQLGVPVLGVADYLRLIAE